MFKRAICTTAFLVALASTSAAHSTPHAYSIEPAHTVVSFEVTNLGIAKRRGVFNQVAGLILLDPQLGSGSIDIRVNAQSIHTGNAATQAFVRGKSFLDVEEFSQIAY
jgi:polyisoprenoid-binding protein YceI